MSSLHASPRLGSRSAPLFLVVCVVLTFPSVAAPMLIRECGEWGVESGDSGERSGGGSREWERVDPESDGRGTLTGECRRSVVQWVTCLVCVWWLVGWRSDRLLQLAGWPLPLIAAPIVRGRSAPGLINIRTAPLRSPPANKRRGSRKTIISHSRTNKQRERNMTNKHGWCGFACLIRMRMKGAEEETGPCRRFVFVVGSLLFLCRSRYTNRNGKVSNICGLYHSIDTTIVHRDQNDRM